MQRIKIMGLALVAVFAFAAIASASAFAAPEWLLNGAAITSPVSVSSKSVGKLELADLGAGTSILCEGTDTGTVGPKAHDLISNITATSCSFMKAGSCESSKPVTAKAVNLPWLTELYDENSEVRDDVTSEVSGKEPGWVVECTVLGFFEVSDECTGLTTTGMDNVSGGVDALFDGKAPKADCSIGGENEGDVSGVDLNQNPTGDTLTVMK